MKASILTFSQTGNTFKTGISIGNGLQNSGVTVCYINFLRRKKWTPDDADLIGIGCPVFENRPAEVMPDFLQDSGFDFGGKKAFVFITSGGSPAKSLWHLAKAVRGTGAKVIGGIQLRGTCTYPTLFGIYPDRPNEMELKAAENFGQAIAANILKGDPLPEKYEITPSIGGAFYDRIGPFLNYLKKKTTPLPINDSDNCDLCGNCVRECPTGSIKIKDKVLHFYNTCIVCYRCWHVCPRNSISMKMSPVKGLIERTVYSERMERTFGNLKPDELVGPNLYKDTLARKLKLKYNQDNPTAEYEYNDSPI